MQEGIAAIKREGSAARVAGKGLGANEYEPHCEAGRAWSDGWHSEDEARRISLFPYLTGSIKPPVSVINAMAGRIGAYPDMDHHTQATMAFEAMVKAFEEEFTKRGQ